MFWWLWSTKKKVMVLLGVLVLPIAALLVFSRFSGDTETAEAPTESTSPVSDAGDTDQAGNITGSETTDEDAAPEPATEQNVPLLFAADASRSATTVLGEVAWLINDSMTPNVILPGAGEGYSLWALHQDVGSFTELADRYVTLYDFAGDVSVEEKTDSLRRLTFTGSAQGVEFTARVRLLDVGGGRVSVAGVVTTDGVPGPVTSEPKRPVQQPTTTDPAPVTTDAP
jgi:hypothetical protein